jgi:hypothetical protein
MSGGTVEDLYLRVSQVTGQALVQLAILFTPAFRSPAHATTPRKRRDIGINIVASHRGSLCLHVYIDAIGVPRGCQTNLKPKIKLQQDLNQYSFGGPP